MRLTLLLGKLKTLNSAILEPQDLVISLGVPDSALEEEENQDITTDRDGTKQNSAVCSHKATEFFSFYFFSFLIFYD